MQLADKLDTFRLDEMQRKALKKLGLFTVADLLFYFPVRYSDISELRKIAELSAGEMATVYGKVSNLKTRKAFRSKIPMAEGQIEDLTGKIKIIWFNQAYLAKMIKEGESIKLTGKVTQSKSGLYLANPEFEKLPSMPIDTHNTIFGGEGGAQEVVNGLSYPIYREVHGITSKWFYHTVEKIIKDKTLENLEDYIPSDILKKYNLPSLKSALHWIHMPKKKSDAESARKRFAFEEVFFIQLERQREKLEYKKNKSFDINTKKSDIEKFLAQFPFRPTNAQTNAIKIILEDMKRGYPMSRLLEGDVGSGKTLVAATASYATIINPRASGLGHLQVAYMAPTEILATQHFESFIKYFENTGIQVGLITGSGCRKFPSKVAMGRKLGEAVREASKVVFAMTRENLPSQDRMRTTADASLTHKMWTDISRAQLLKWVANGEISILIGTHALIQKSVKFRDLATVIIDEQHRFGVSQRKKLSRKEDILPHLLSMTATPIPRTLALTIYGDLDLTLLDEMPAGRKQIITEIITPDKRDNVYEDIRKELANGRQLYVICPRIFEPDPEKELALNVKSATEEAKRLKKEVFKECIIGVLHSKMSKLEKESVMQEFSDGRIDILCATSVVEVGVNVPNATMIIIEGGERFGLAQLHQLRGRVLRSTHQAYCYVFASTYAKASADKDAKNKTLNRLKALITAKNGFELAELDLALRGAGELGGTKQWGITDLGMEAIKNIKMVEAARTEAVKLIETDPELKEYTLLKQKTNQKAGGFHFE